MRIGVPKEIKIQEYRVGVTPGAVRDGRWMVGMGVGAGFRNNLLTKSGARVRLDGKGIVTVETDMTDKLSQELKDNLVGHIALKRIGLAEDVAAAVRFLASEEASYITGHVLNVNGGLYM